MLYKFFSSSYIMNVKVAPIKPSLSKWYMLPSFCLCLCMRVCFVCHFSCDYITIGLWVGELLKIKLLLLLLLLLILMELLYFFFFLYFCLFCPVLSYCFCSYLC
jgi:hypothetical protein